MTTPASPVPPALPTPHDAPFPHDRVGGRAARPRGAGGCSDRRARRRGGRARIAATIGLAVALGGCPTPGVATTDVTLGQTVLEMTDAVNALRDQTSLMQAQIDSLRGVVARQDSTIARLSAAAGVSP